MAKRSPEQGNPDQEFLFKTDTVNRLSVLETEINEADISAEQKDHLIKAAKEIVERVNSFDGSASTSSKKEFKNQIHLGIKSLKAEFDEVKRSKRKKEDAKGFNWKELKNKEKRKEKVEDLLAELEKARKHLAEESVGIKEGVLFKNFARYKKAKEEISALAAISDDEEYKAKENELMAEILALHEIKKEEKQEDVPAKTKEAVVVPEKKEEVVVGDPKEKMADAENLQPEPEEEKKEKPVHKTKKTQKRKADVLDDVGQEQRVKKNDHAVKRWDILQEIIGKMLGEDSISEETTDAVDNNLKIMLASSDAEEYERSMSEFERNFDLIVNTIPKEARLEYFSQLNGKAPSWENKSVKETAKKVVATPDTNNVVDKDTPEYRHKRYQDMEDKFILLKKIAIEMMTGKQRDATRDLVQEIDQSLETTYHTKNSREHDREMDRAESAFAELLTKIPPEVKAEFESVLAGNAPSFKREAAVKKEEVSESPRELSAEERDERDFDVERFKKEWSIFERALKDKMTKSEWEDLSVYVDIIKSSLAEAGTTKFVDEYYVQLRRFKNIYSKLMDKIGEDLKREGENAVAADYVKNYNEKKAVDQEKEKEINERNRRVKILERIMRQIFESQDKNYNFSETKTALLVGTAIKTLDDAKKYLSVGTQDEYEKNINIADGLTKEAWASIPKGLKERVRQEFDLVVSGKETSGTRMEKERYENKIKTTEDNLYLFEQIMDEQDKNLRTKFAPELQAVRDSILEARGSVDAEEFYEEKEDKLMRAFGKLSFPEELKEVKNKFYSRLVEDADDPSLTRLDMKVSDINAAVAELEKEPSPEQKKLLQMYERDFGVLEKVLQNSGNPEIADTFKWKVDVIRNNIDKAKKEMSQHNKLDETVLYNMQALVEDLQKHYPKLHAEFMQKISPQVPVAPAPEKKGFFARAKETVGALFTKETGKKVVRGAYETVARVSGLKIASDFVYGLATGKGDLSKGKGDLAEYVRGKRESKAAQVTIAAAYENLVSAIERSEKGGALGENEQIEKRMAYLQSSVEAANISSDAKKQILQRLEFIYYKHKEDTDKAKTARTEELKKLLDAYVRAKVEGLQIAKDALNFAFSATGFMFLRGAMYLSVSVAERFQKGKKEYAKQNAGMVGAKSELAFVAKDAIVNTAIETARVLAGQGAKAGETKLQRAADVVKLASRVLTAFGIAGAAFSETDTATQTLDKFLNSAKEDGVVETILDNSIQNIKHVGANIERGAHKAGNLVEQAWDKVTGHESIAPEITPPSPVAELPKEEVVAPVNTASVEPVPEAPAPEVVPFSVQDFAAEHKLSKESLVPLQKLVEQYPSLKQESLSRILEASKVGDGVKFHHADLVRGDVDTLIEAEGERRSVIFEELVKAKDYEGAAKYLEGQGFSSAHKSYITDYVGKGTHEDYLKFVAQYDEKPDKKMVYGLFRALQGKGNTELANAGLFKAATENMPGRTVSLQGGELEYFGLNEKGEPILSGQGRVVVKETILAKITTSPTTISEVRVTDAPSVDDQLRLNADEIRTMKGELPKHDETENALPVHMKDDAEREVLSQVEADKARFAALGKQHVDIVERARAGEPVDTPVAGASIQTGEGNEGVEVVGEETTTEKTFIGKTVKTYTASGEVVQPTAGTVHQEAKPVGVKSVEAVSAAKIAPVELEKEIKTPAAEKALLSEAQTKEMIANLKLTFDRHDTMSNEILSNTVETKHFIFKGNAKSFLNEQIRKEPAIRDWIKFVEVANKASASGEPLDPAIFKELGHVQKSIDAYIAYTSNPNANTYNQWLKTFDSKELQLALDGNVDNLSMLANGSHVVRISDKAGAEFMLSDSKHTFIIKDDKLFKMNKGDVVQEYTYEEAVAMAKKTSGK